MDDQSDYATPSPGYTVMGETFSILLERYTAALETKTRYRDRSAALLSAVGAIEQRIDAVASPRLKKSTILSIINEEIAKVR